MLPTASRLAIAAKCVWPWSSGARWPQREISPAAELGIRTHEAIACILRGEPEDAVISGARPDARPLIEAAMTWWHRVRDADPRAHFGLGGYDVLPEQPVAWSPPMRRGRLLDASVGHRFYTDLAPHDIGGTADVLAIPPAEDLPVVVIDWKTGMQGTLEPASRNLQLGAMALAARDAVGARSASAVIVRLDPGAAQTDWADLDCVDMDAIEGELRRIMARLDEPPRAVPGYWCQYCPCIGVCPASKSAMTAIAPSDVATPESAADITDNGHALRLLVSISLAEEALARVRDMLRAWADAHGGVRDGERVWRASKRRVETIDASHPDAVRILLERVPDACDIRTSRAAIRRIYGRDAERDIMDALRGVGAVRESFTVAYGWHRSRDDEEE